jgi:hypothetical protein
MANDVPEVGHVEMALGSCSMMSLSTVETRSNGDFRERWVDSRDAVVAIADRSTIIGIVVAEDPWDRAYKDWVCPKCTFKRQIWLAMPQNVIRDHGVWPVVRSFDFPNRNLDELHAIALRLGYVDGAEVVWCRRILEVVD